MMAMVGRDSKNVNVWGDFIPWHAGEKKKIMVRLQKIIKKHNIGFWTTLNCGFSPNPPFQPAERNFDLWNLEEKYKYNRDVKNGKATDVQCSHTFNSLNTLLLCFLNDRKSNAMWCVFGGFHWRKRLIFARRGAFSCAYWGEVGRYSEEKKNNKRVLFFPWEFICGWSSEQRERERVKKCFICFYGELHGKLRFFDSWKALHCICALHKIFLD